MELERILNIPPHQGDYYDPFQTQQRASLDHHYPSESIVLQPNYTPRASIPQHPVSQAPALDRPPKRRAAHRAKYNLAKAWSSLDTYLSNEGSSELGDYEGTDNEVDDGKVKTKKTARVTRRLADMSGDESDSDEYKDEDVAISGRRAKRQRSSDSGEGRRAKRKERVVPSKHKVSRREMRGLLEFMARKTDWIEAARFVGTEQSISTKNGQPTNGATGKKLTRSRHKEGVAEKASRLSLHWEEVLSKKILSKYKR